MNNSMAKIQFFDSLTAADLLQRARGDSEAAKDLLLMAAKYIRNGDPMPAALGDYLADALETAVNSPATHDPYKCDTGNALLTALYLKHSHRPTTGVNPLAVCGFMFNEMVYVEGMGKEWILTDADGNTVDIGAVSQTEAAKRASNKFGISVSTAKRYFRENIDEYMQLYSADPPDEEDKNWLADMQKRV